MKKKIRLILEISTIIILILFNVFYDAGIVKTNSMEPALKVGSFVLYKKCDASDVETGDIVLFKYEGRRISHRVVSADERYIYTKGDALDEQDPPISKENICSKLIFHTEKE